MPEPPPPRIARALPSDAASLTRIAYAAKRHWGYSEALMRAWAADLTVTPQLVERDPVYLVARGERIAGFYALSRGGDALELEHMWVEPAEMGAALGALLFAHALATARALGGATLRIASDPHAEGFYLRMGARRVGDVASTPPGRTLPLLVVDLRAPAAGRAGG